MMFKKFLCSVAAVAVVALAAPSAASAATIDAYYSYNGGVLTALADSDAAADSFSFSGVIGAFTFNSLSAQSQPTSDPNHLTVFATDNHRGNTTDTLKLYFVATGLLPGGSQTFTSQFTSNALGGNMTVNAFTYLGTPTAPGTLLGSASFPPLLGTGASVTSTVVAAGYTLTGELEITAKGTQSSVTSITVSAVPGPIVGAGLPGLIAACGGLLALARRRRKQAF